MTSLIVLLDAHNVIGLGGKEVLERHEEYATELFRQSNGNYKLLILGHHDLIENSKSCNLKHLKVLDVKSDKRAFVFSASKYLKELTDKVELLVAGDPWKSGAAALITRKLCKKNFLVEIQLHADIFANGWARKSLRNAIKYFVARIVISKSDIVRTVSFRQAENLKKLRGAFDKTYTVPLPIQISAKQNKHRNISDQLVFGFLGRLHKDRGTELLIQIYSEVLSKFPEVSLVIAGDGQEKSTLERNLVDKFPGQVKLLGYLSGDATKLFWEQIDVLVSLAEYESYGRVPRESICWATPVLALQSSGILDLVSSDLKGWVEIFDPRIESSELVENCKKLVKTASELPTVDSSRFYIVPIKSLVKAWLTNSEARIS
jgi:glycosyltransferase involved in cell wall biosynthesis